MTEGQKFDQGKPDWSLVPWEELEEVVKVLTHGKEKYGAQNWKMVPEARDRYFAAALRHLTTWQTGDLVDESGHHHLAHAICSLLFLMWFDSLCDTVDGLRAAVAEEDAARAAKQYLAERKAMEEFFSEDDPEYEPTPPTSKIDLGGLNQDEVIAFRRKAMKAVRKGKREFSYKGHMFKRAW